MKQRRINSPLKIAALALATLFILSVLPLIGVFPLPASARPLVQQGENAETLGQIGGGAYVTSTVIHVPDDYPTIQEAVDAASSGDTIIVRDGIYTENVQVRKSLTIKSENGAGATIVEPEISEFWSSIFWIGADHVSLSGFMVQNNTPGSGIQLYEASNCTISNNIVLNNRYGIYLRWSNNNTIINNTAAFNDWLFLSNENEPI